MSTASTSLPEGENLEEDLEEEEEEQEEEKPKGRKRSAKVDPKSEPVPKRKRPASKPKAAAKQKAKNTRKAKETPAKPSSSSTLTPNERKKRNSRKSSAYHVAKVAAIKDGKSMEEAKALAKQASRRHACAFYILAYDIVLHGRACAHAVVANAKAYASTN